MAFVNTASANVGYPTAVTPRADYLNGFKFTNDGTTPNTLLNVAAGQCLDSTGQFDFFYAAANLDMTKRGLNGLDTGTIAASTDYAVYVIGDTTLANSTGLIASTNFASLPVMPTTTNGTGYNIIRRIGVLKTDGSAHILPFTQISNHFQKTYIWASAISVTPGSLTTGYVAQALTAGMPPLQLQVIFTGGFTPATAGHVLIIAPGTTITNPGIFNVSGSVAAIGQAFGPALMYPTLISGVPNVYLKSDSASDGVSLDISGFIDLL